MLQLPRSPTVRSIGNDALQNFAGKCRRQKVGKVYSRFSEYGFDLRRSSVSKGCSRENAEPASRRIAFQSEAKNLAIQLHARGNRTRQFGLSRKESRCIAELERKAYFMRIATVEESA
ncbi:hypothetical protein HN011_009071 [Eciton burchellii]|nr:hypothetical protein HN011_009071 [Eciton burchellii]